MTRTLLALDLGTHSFTRQRLKRGGMHAAISREDVA